MSLQVVMLTREYPPDVYGGAGVHVDYLTRYLSQIMKVEVRTFGDQDYRKEDLQVRGFRGWEILTEGSEEKLQKVLTTMAVDLALIKDPIKSNVIHAHTWYTMLAGFLAHKMYGLPLVVTVHSLEPLRPWKREQLGRGYDVSSWLEKTGIEGADKVVAVSGEMKEDIQKYYEVEEDKIEIIHNGIDLEEYKAVYNTSARQKYGIERDFILFVGRISRQKGIDHLLKAVEYLPDSIQVVLCAGKPDTKELLIEVKKGVEKHDNIIWINKMLPVEEIVQLYTQASVFVCPSVYEPFGIINLEAMACKTPVVASAVGGITEVVRDGETGVLVEPGQPRQLAEAISNLLVDPDLRERMGEAGRKRVEENFSWQKIAARTKEMYRQLIK